MKTLPTITLIQPWASWVSLGWKTIETRLHPRFANLKGLRIGIHAGRVWDYDAHAAAARFLTDEQFHRSSRDSAIWHTRGEILCTALVKDFRKCVPEDGPAAMIECRTPRFGLVLEDVQPIGPFPARGMQGIWYWRMPEPMPEPEPRCRECGCMDTRGCPEGCAWVEPGLCSECAENRVVSLKNASTDFADALR
ncbi:MAG TPA: hypothetical protein PLB89_05025 [Flavobacteriales bacterium]|nr:hypothetical protein [Flavobacteriales bacterium]